MKIANQGGFSPKLEVWVVIQAQQALVRLTFLNSVHMR